MPILEYRCPTGHVTERLRTFARRDEPVACGQCGAATARVEISQPHCLPDGMYSYAPNLGDANHFERRREAMKTGQKVFKKEVPSFKYG